MKKNIILIIVVVVACAGGWYYYSLNNAPSGTPVGTQNNPGTPIIQVKQPEKVSEISKNKDVTNDFNVQINGGGRLTLDEPVVASQYAIQTWSDENKGGQALLHYKQGQGWVLITMGGGAWSVDDLTKLGVPQETAKELLKTPTR